VVKPIKENIILRIDPAFHLARSYEELVAFMIGPEKE
jgi:hypothetical protein